MIPCSRSSRAASSPLSAPSMVKLRMPVWGASSRQPWRLTPAISRESVGEPAHQAALVLGHRRDPALGQPAAGGAETGDPGAVGGAGLEPVGQVFGHLLALGARAGAAAHERLDIEVLAEQQTPDTRRAEQTLVAGADVGGDPESKKSTGRLPAVWAPSTTTGTGATARAISATGSTAPVTLEAWVTTTSAVGACRRPGAGSPRRIGSPSGSSPGTTTTSTPRDARASAAAA